MTSLNTHIPIEYIKRNKKLQEIECRESYSNEIPTKDKFVFNVQIICPKPTIADIIDNAEMLFGKENGKTKCWETIILMCLTDVSIQEISEYIIKNII